MERQYFSSLKNQKKQISIFHKILQVPFKMKTQKIIKLMNYSSNDKSKFATKNGMLQTVKQQKINTTKTFLSERKY